VNQSGVSDRQLIGSTVLTALASMATADGPFALDELLVEIDIDSLDLVELTQILEDECEVSVPTNAFADVTSIGDVIDVVRSHLP